MFAMARSGPSPHGPQGCIYKCRLSASPSIDVAWEKGPQANNFASHLHSSCHLASGARLESLAHHDLKGKPPAPRAVSFANKRFLDFNFLWQYFIIHTYHIYDFKNWYKFCTSPYASFTKLRAMVEPVGITLAAAGLLYPIYQACDDLYHGYKLTRSFGDDFDLVQLELEMQYSRLEKTSETRDVELHGLDRPSDINNSNHRVTSIVVRTLSQIKVQFELANKLLGKYDETGTPVC